MRHIADDSLATFIHGHMLHPHCLVAGGAVSLKRLQLVGEGPCQLVKSPLGAVLLRDVVYMIEAASEGHGRVVDRRHLSRQHRFQLIARFDARHHGEHEIELSLVHDPTFRRGIGEVCESPSPKNWGVTTHSDDPCTCNTEPPATNGSAIEADEFCT